MKTIKVKLKDAEKTKKELIQKRILSTNHKIIKEKNHIYFPVTKTLKGYEYEEKEFEETKSKDKDLRTLIKKHFTEEELKKLKTSFDVIGEIAILEIDEELRKKEKIIADTLLKSHKSIKTVLRKDDKHEGEYRTQKMKWLAGKKTKETTHKENNVTLKLNVETVYFSPRLATERKRIAEQVRKGEEILVMFSGCAPYPCVLSKNTDAKHITGIELNPEGHEYAKKNVAINKLKNITLINDDVKKACKKMTKKYDRILMPLPKNAEDFLEPALHVAKKNTTIHFYNFLHETEFEEAERKVKEACKKKKLKYKKKKLIKAGQQSPRTYRICLDFEVY